MHHSDEWSPYSHWDIYQITKGYIGRNILGYSPFASQKGIKSIEFGPNVTIIPHNFLYGSSVEEDSGLLSFKIPEGIKIVGDHAFASNNINHFVGLDRIEEIGKYAFVDKEFETLDLSAAKYIGKKAFLRCRNLKEVRFHLI